MTSRYLCLAALAAGVAAPASAQQFITNGGFETGDLTGWTRSVQDGSAGTVDTTSLAIGQALPLSDLPANGPAGGMWYATTDQEEAGSYALSQAFTLPVMRSNYMVSFDLAVTNYADEGLVDPGHLNYGAGDNNQQVRVDILDMTGSSVILNLVHDATAAPPGEPPQLPNPYVHYEMDISAFVESGQTYIFRFASVDNMSNLTAAIDNVSIVPAPGAALSAAVAVTLLRRRRD